MAKKVEKYTLEKEFVAYGHYELTVTDSKGIIFKSVTGDTDLIDRLNSEFKEEKEKATTDAIALVLNESL